jgi:hypothetical protein
MESKLTLDRVKYSCKSNNKTMIYIKKDFLNEALEKATLKQILLHLSNVIFDSSMLGRKEFGQRAHSHLAT